MDVIHQNIVKLQNCNNTGRSKGKLNLDKKQTNLGSEVKSRSGIGIFLTIYSERTSILYFNWAEIGMIGAFSAAVLFTNSTMSLCCSVAWGIYFAQYSLVIKGAGGPQATGGPTLKRANS